MNCRLAAVTRWPKAGIPPLMRFAPETAYATNGNGDASVRLKTASILFMTFFIGPVSAGEISSKEQSHFGQHQRCTMSR